MFDELMMVGKFIKNYEHYVLQKLMEFQVRLSHEEKRNKEERTILTPSGSVGTTRKTLTGILNLANQIQIQ